LEKSGISLTLGQCHTEQWHKVAPVHTTKGQQIHLAFGLALFIFAAKVSIYVEVLKDQRAEILSVVRVGLEQAVEEEQHQQKADKVAGRVNKAHRHCHVAKCITLE